MRSFFRPPTLLPMDQFSYVQFTCGQHSVISQHHGQSAQVPYSLWNKMSISSLNLQSRTYVSKKHDCQLPRFISGRPPEHALARVMPGLGGIPFSISNACHPLKYLPSIISLTSTNFSSICWGTGQACCCAGSGGLTWRRADRFDETWDSVTSQRRTWPHSHYLLRRCIGVGEWERK